MPRPPAPPAATETYWGSVVAGMWLAPPPPYRRCSLPVPRTCSRGRPSSGAPTTGCSMPQPTVCADLAPLWTTPAGRSYPSRRAIVPPPTTPPIAYAPNGTPPAGFAPTCEADLLEPDSLNPIRGVDGSEHGLCDGLPGPRRRGQARPSRHPRHDAGGFQAGRAGRRVAVLPSPATVTCRRTSARAPAARSGTLPSWPRRWSTTRTSSSSRAWSTALPPAATPAA